MLEANRERLDNLNVYPVPDGDTGTNMTLTVSAVKASLDASKAETPAEVVREVSRACLMGARGNSGVILSQIVRGAVDAIAAQPALDTAALAAALRSGSDAAYASLREPQEGTILTIARELAERAEELGSSALALSEALTELVAHGEAALARTPDQLPRLKEAGVVDAGGAGLLEILRGIAAHVRREPLPEAPPPAELLPLEAVHGELSRFRYCTSFYVEGEEVDPDRLERELLALGDSVLVAGARGAAKGHVHTDEPGRALSLATAVGVIEEVDVKNMHAQIAERTERLSAEKEAPAPGRGSRPAASAVVAVCGGSGNARLFRSLGAAAVVEGSRSVNPTVADLAAVIDAVPAEDVLVLPNHASLVLTAEQAAQASGKTVSVIPTRTIQAGLGAIVAYDPASSGEENAAKMEHAARLVRAGAVTRAARSVRVDGLEVEEGQFLGLVDAKPVASGLALEAVARAVAERLLDESSDVLTILLGEGVSSGEALRRELETAHPEIEIEVHEGGQPHYPLLLAAE